MLSFFMNCFGYISITSYFAFMFCVTVSPSYHAQNRKSFEGRTKCKERGKNLFVLYNKQNKNLLLMKLELNDIKIFYGNKLYFFSIET